MSVAMFATICQMPLFRVSSLLMLTLQSQEVRPKNSLRQEPVKVAVGVPPPELCCWSLIVPAAPLIFCCCCPAPLPPLLELGLIGVLLASTTPVGCANAELDVKSGIIENKVITITVAMMDLIDNFFILTFNISIKNKKQQIEGKASQMRLCHNFDN